MPEDILLWMSPIFKARHLKFWSTGIIMHRKEKNNPRIVKFNKSNRRIVCHGCPGAESGRELPDFRSI